jgi:hypothetical protein
MDFTNFIVGSNAIGGESVWQIPPYCIVEQNPIDMPELPKSFSSEIEITDHIQQSTFHYKEYYDTLNNMARVETHGPTGKNVTVYRVNEVTSLSYAVLNIFVEKEISCFR